MHTHKTGKKLAVFVIGAGIVLAAGAAVFLRPSPTTQPKSEVNDNKNRNISTVASPEFDYSHVQFGQQIMAGQAYLTKAFSTITPNRRLLLDYLQRQYGLGQRFSAQHNPISPPIRDQHEDPAQFEAFRRIAYPESLVNALPPAPDDPMTQMMMAAMQCDHIPLPADFGKLVQRNIDAGGYNLTHVVFSLKRMQENNCNFFSSVQQQNILNSVADGMVKIVNTSVTIPDLRYEAIAFLLDIGRRELVRLTWLEQIAKERQPDGRWRSHTAENSTDDDHATILALWALCVYARPDIPVEPMIQHPEQAQSQSRKQSTPQTIINTGDKH